MKSFLFLLVAYFAAAPAMSGCPWKAEFVSPAVRPQSPKVFEGVNHFMLTPFIIKQLGPAARDVGSSVHLLEWEVTDGRVFFVATADSCGKPVEVGFRRMSSDSSYKPNPHRS